SRGVSHRGSHARAPRGRLGAGAGRPHVGDLARRHARRGAPLAPSDDQLAGGPDRPADCAPNAVLHPTRLAARAGALRRPPKLHGPGYPTRMSVEPAWLRPRPAEPADEPIVPEAIPAVLPRRLRFHSLRDEVRNRLLQACALERLPPERFGFSVASATRLFMITCALYRWYFRTRCFGLENLPSSPFMLVSNHGSHVLSWDGANIVTACLLDADPPRLVHAMAEHRLMELPILGRAPRRIGAVDGTRPPRPHPPPPAPP